MFVPMAGVDEHGGGIARPEVRQYSQVAKGYTPFTENDVLFAKITPCMENGKAAIVRGIRGGVGFGSTEFHVLRPTACVLPEWVFSFIRQPSFLSSAKANFTGTAGQQRVPSAFLKTVHIPVPPLVEQERIVMLLDEADELRKLRAQADRRKADLVPAFFHEMFGDPMDNPRGWPVNPVSSFVEELYGGRSVNPAGADEAAGRYRVLKTSAVTCGAFKPEESKPVPAVYEPPESHFVRAGDLLFSRANTTELVAATTYVFDTPPNLLLPDKLWRFVWKQPQSVEPLFVWWLFQAPSIRRELGQRATGTGGSMKNISKPKVMTLEVPIPPFSLQKQFAHRVTEIRELESTQAASRRRLEDLLQSLLHRAFNGDL
jgi:type I restriction enzyme S subunit